MLYLIYLLSEIQMFWRELLPRIDTLLLLHDVNPCTSTTYLVHKEAHPSLDNIRYQGRGDHYHHHFPSLSDVLLCLRPDPKSSVVTTGVPEQRLSINMRTFQISQIPALSLSGQVFWPWLLPQYNNIILKSINAYPPTPTLWSTSLFLFWTSSINFNF